MIILVLNPEDLSKDEQQILNMLSSKFNDKECIENIEDEEECSRISKRSADKKANGTIFKNKNIKSIDNKSRMILLEEEDEDDFFITANH
jgi:hypothetical protein